MDPKRIRKERGRGPSFVKNATEPFLSNEKREDIPSFNSNEETQSSGTDHFEHESQAFFPPCSNVGWVCTHPETEADRTIYGYDHSSSKDQYIGPKSSSSALGRVCHRYVRYGMYLCRYRPIRSGMSYNFTA